MTNAELIVTIRNEIERLENYYTSVEWYVEALLSFLSTLEEEPVDVSRDENIGLSIMFFLGTHVKHEDSVLVHGKGGVTYQEACEWIRRNITREKSEKLNQDELKKESAFLQEEQLIKSELKEEKNECSPVIKEFISKFFEIGRAYNFGFGPKDFLQEQSEVDLEKPINQDEDLDEQMLSSIETELLTLADTYAFTFECPDSTDEEKEHTRKAIAFKHKQIEWLKTIYNSYKTNNNKL